MGKHLTKFQITQILGNKQSELREQGLSWAEVNLRVIRLQAQIEGTA